MVLNSQRPPAEKLTNPVPLCVDLDGTLIKSDTLIEALLVLAKTRPIDLFLLPFWVVRGKAQFKARIAQRVDIDPELLPYNEMLLGLLRAEKAAGRELILATAANERIARAIAEYLGIFSDVMASDAHINNSGEKKLNALKRRYGAGNFDYAANGRIDIPIWAQARAAWLVNPDRGVEASLGRIAKIERRIETRGAWAGMMLKVLHAHHWPKYLLVFLPLLAAYRWELLSSVQVGLGFIAFSLCASGANLVNDMLNLPADRNHPIKRQRPLASGEFSLKGAGLLAAGLWLGGFGIAVLLPSAFWVLLACYFVIALSYSLYR